MLNIIWDFDCTLIDSEAEIMLHLGFALQDSSVSVSDQIRPFRMGPPFRTMIEDAFPTGMFTEEKLLEIRANFRKRYDNSGFTMTNCYDGIEKIISDTSNFVHHIVTNKPDVSTKTIIEKLNWTNYITSVRTPYSISANGTETVRSKTELFAETIAKYGNDISHFVGVGDMKTDCIAARENNITAIGVLWGAGTRDELTEHCDYLFENVGQLREFLYKGC